MIRWGAALSLALLLDGCGAPTPRPPAVTTAVSTAPGAAAVGVRYRIDPARSQVLILVYRDGPMANLGHNHVIAVRQLDGEVRLADDRAQSQVHLTFPVSALSVDEPELRAAQGPDFQTQITPQGVAGTRDHMLGDKLLDAMHYASIELESVGLRNLSADQWQATIRVRVRDHVTDVVIPVALNVGAGELVANGEFDLSHATLGLTPYSVALGALRVADRMHVIYRLVGKS